MAELRAFSNLAGDIIRYLEAATAKDEPYPVRQAMVAHMIQASVSKAMGEAFARLLEPSR